ncbi:TVP38/TMEM64 family protein [Sedimentibacter saalensis]|uniref:TVP38/TMEM64 family membrane protein n=1 Tax=Sedimentibacter saalensis TaxID=130788 RepID=A0A562JBM1_9FIRM|nr:VTT domain-containing protein [Sedimentibacter saalensis]TWH80500.1 putative membrane protein YdjX (TVP38/TMEM64 family) [Sedimentibacter saalensis]
MDYANYTDVFLNFVEKIGPIAGIILPVIEAFLPVLPLVGFVIINVAVFGFFMGYLYSWIGNCLGSFLLFMLIRKIGGKKIENKIEKSKYKGTLEKIRRKNLTVLFFLYCFPFTPSFLISGTAALTNMNTQQFILALLPSKFVMILSLAFIGQNVSSYFENPAKSLFFIVFILAVNFISKYFIKKYEEYHRKV